MIYIGKSLENDIRREAEKAYPDECCGVLLGETGRTGDKRVRRVEAIINSREESERYHRFLITPEDVLKLELKARGLKLDVLGFYHSHPDCPARPSDYDKENAWPFYSYIITAVNKRISGDFTSWELSEDRESFNSEEIAEDGKTFS
jgi:proteasome lid subunit RPN8/RPN11